MPKLPLYGNQLIDLLCKSTDWFLYDADFGVYCVTEVCKQSPWKRAILRTPTSLQHVKTKVNRESCKSTISEKCILEDIHGVTIF